MTNMIGDEQFIDDHRQVLLSGYINPIHVIKYKPEFYHCELYNQYKVEKPTSINEWVPKRRAQFLAGRIAAKKALAFNMTPTIDKQVGMGHSREPIWPEAFIGSISHAGESSIACISEQNQSSSGLGIDIQETISVKMHAQISSTILTLADNILFNQRYSDLSESDLFTLIFSAKESFFKAAFNSAGQYFDFIDVSIIDLDTTKQQLTLKTNKHLSHDLKKGFEANISYTSLKSPTARMITACHWEL